MCQENSQLAVLQITSINKPKSNPAWLWCRAWKCFDHPWTGNIKSRVHCHTTLHGSTAPGAKSWQEYLCFVYVLAYHVLFALILISPLHRSCGSHGREDLENHHACAEPHPGLVTSHGTDHPRQLLTNQKCEYCVWRIRTAVADTWMQASGKCTVLSCLCASHSHTQLCQAVKNTCCAEEQLGRTAVTYKHAWRLKEKVETKSCCLPRKI